MENFQKIGFQPYFNFFQLEGLAPSGLHVIPAAQAN